MTVAAVLLGGLIGTALRLGIDALVPHDDAGFPLSTFLINVAGSFALGVLVSRVWPAAPGWLRAGLGTGVLGSFTTFSAVIASVYVLSLAGQHLVAAAYLAVSLVVGLAAAWAGLRLGSRRPPVDPAVDE